MLCVIFLITGKKRKIFQVFAFELTDMAADSRLHEHQLEFCN